jgi:hypothetical protein
MTESRQRQMANWSSKQVVGDLWERYLELLNDGTGDAYV